MKSNLVFVSTASLSNCAPELFGEDRNFDVCVHFYEKPERPYGPVVRDGNLWRWREPDGVCYYYQPGEKLNVAGKLFPQTGWLKNYEQFAFYDSDLTVSTDQLNRLFQVGAALKLPLYQPALTPSSYYSHSFTLQQPKGGVRRSSATEIMCPHFSREALDRCLWSFSLNISGWGLDLEIWPKLADTFVIDSIAVGHYNKPARRDRKMSNNLTPFDELAIIQKINYDGDRDW
jgi:hypothetical protein